MNLRTHLGRDGFARGVAANSAARVLALVGLTAATVAVGRTGGPAAVGDYALLRMLPGIVGVLAVAGLPGALGYFLAGNRRDHPGTWPTIAVIATVGSLVGTVVWLAATPVIARVLFPDVPALLVAAAGVTVPTQLLLTVGKTALQGLQDRRAADAVIAAEEIAFLPCYLVPLVFGIGGTAALIVGLAAADLLVAAGAWWRVGHRLGWNRHRLPFLGSRPSRPLAREITSYGMRGQVGGLINLLNLRLDFVVLGALAGPAVLGAYAVASKYAELVRLPGIAFAWIGTPRMAAQTPAAAARSARRLLVPALPGVAALAIPLAVLAGPITSLLYGDQFAGAVRPAQILLVGMLFSAAAGVATAYLYGRGRPGRNSLALSVGLVATLVLDFALIPAFGATGAAVASCVAYLLGDGLLVLLLLRSSRRDLAGAEPTRAPETAVA